jgi:hypothetical protein
MGGLTSTVETRVAAPPAVALGRIAPIELARIFRGYGPLPAVLRTRDQTGAWDATGQTRTVELSEGSTAREQLLTFEAPRYFGYRVSDFSGSLRWLTVGPRGMVVQPFIWRPRL